MVKNSMTTTGKLVSLRISFRAILANPGPVFVEMLAVVLSCIVERL